MPTFHVLHLASPRRDPSAFEGTPYQGMDFEISVPNVIYEAMSGRNEQAVREMIYSHVATLEAADLEDVFGRTNHIDESWTDDERNGAIQKNARSTSMGDLVVDEAGACWSCAAFGWQELPAENVAPLLARLNLSSGLTPAP